MNDWHDIKDIEDFREYYEFNNFVIVASDPSDEDFDSDYTDIAFGIDLFPVGVKRFFCVPNDES